MLETAFLSVPVPLSRKYKSMDTINQELQGMEVPLVEVPSPGRRAIRFVSSLFQGA